VNPSKTQVNKMASKGSKRKMGEMDEVDLIREIRRKTQDDDNVMEPIFDYVCILFPRQTNLFF